MYYIVCSEKYRKVIFHILLLSFSFFNFLWGCSLSKHITLTPLLQCLINDMKLYKLDSEGDPYLHAGDLYEHSMWTYNAMAELLNGDTPYGRHVFLTDRQKEVVALAALLHDIGKAGRKDFFERTHPTLYYEMNKNAEGVITHITYKQDRQEHPHISFEYTAKPFLKENKNYRLRDYYVVNPKSSRLTAFNIAQMYDELGLSLEEQKVLAVLLGIHYEFGNLNGNKITNQMFLARLDNLVKVVNYNEGNLDEFIIHGAILIQVADVKGLVPVPGYQTPLFPGGIQCDSSHKEIKYNNPFKSFGYGDSTYAEDTSSGPAVVTMNNLWNFFMKNIENWHSDLLMHNIRSASPAERVFTKNMYVNI